MYYSNASNCVGAHPRSHLARTVIMCISESTIKAHFFLCIENQNSGSIDQGMAHYLPSNLETFDS